MGRRATPYSIWSQSLDLHPLEDDRCASDECAVCAYFHKKSRGLRGHVLSERDAECVGLVPTPPSSGGWHYPSFADVVANRLELSSADSTRMQALMQVGDVSRSMASFLAE